MSTQRGNIHRHRAQKHKNQTAFKNKLHCNEKTKFINSLRAEGCCARCKDIIEWKIKYKKYKPLTQPKKCIKCEQKAVNRAYFIVCPSCAEKYKICVKCGKEEEIVLEIGLSEEELLKNQAQLEQELKHLPERKRRAFLRLQASGKLNDEVRQEGAAICRSKSDEGCDNCNDISSSDDESDSDSGGDAENSVEQENMPQSEQNTVHITKSEGTCVDSNAISCPEKSKGNETDRLEDKVTKLDI